MQRLPIDEAAERVTNFLHAMTLEIQMLARACGKSRRPRPRARRHARADAGGLDDHRPAAGRHRRVFGGGPGWKGHTDSLTRNAHNSQ